MNAKIWIGLLLVAVSYGQLLLPRRIFTHPEIFFHGYPIVPGNILALAAAYSTLGIILLGEGICQRFRAPSLMDRVTRSGRAFARFLGTAAVAGLTMEALGQWLGKLWVYPYWTNWLYWIVVIPGFAFYWTAIAESYLAVKAVLDARFAATARRPALSAARTRGASQRGASQRGATRGLVAVGAIGTVFLLATAVGYAAWYASHGGYVFANTRPVAQAPPFWLVLLGFLGALLLAEQALGRRGTPSLFGSLRKGYWHPAAVVIIVSVLLAVLLETLNAVNHFWQYTHFPYPRLTLAGIQLSMVATWPLQYLTFLLIPSLLMPALADLFWRPRA